MVRTKQLLGLDVGAARIGAALADSAVRIAIPNGVVEVDGSEIEALARLVIDNEVSTIVVGYPRNQSGEATAQTAAVEAFVEKLRDFDADIVFQDESLTSVMAENRLKARGGTYSKADIDSEAATIILQDYLEQHL